jgi:hypothetical protein
VQFLPGNRDALTLGRCGFDNPNGNHFDNNGLGSPRLESIVPGFGACSCGLLFWLEKAAWVPIDAVCSGSAWNEPVHRLQSRSMVKH